MPRRPDLLVAPEFGVRLRELRRGLGLPVRELADGVHVSPATISGLESGSRSPSRAMVDHLDRALSAGGRLRELVTVPPPDTSSDLDRLAWAECHPDRMDAGHASDLATLLAGLRHMDDHTTAASLLPTIDGSAHLFTAVAVADGGAPVAAEFSQFTGWIYTQLGRHHQADQHYAHSASLALAAGAPGLASQSLRMRGSLHLFERDDPAAASRHYLAAAQVRGAGALHVVDAHIRAAHALAGLGDHSGAGDELRTAARLNDRANDVDPEPFAYWLSASWLRLPLGLALLDLGDHARAGDELRAGLEALLPATAGTSAWATTYLDALARADAGV